MDTDILFEEVQGSGNKQTHDFFKVTAAIFAVAAAVNLLIQKGDTTPFTTALLTGLFLCAIAAVFTSTKMITQVRKDGIYVRFPPFQPTNTKFSWDHISDIYLRTYDPVSEYGGWGIKVGSAGRGYIVSGNTGIQLELSNNAKVLIGTQKPKEFAEVLSRVKQLS